MVPETIAKGYGSMFFFFAIYHSNLKVMVSQKNMWYDGFSFPTVNII